MTSSQAIIYEQRNEPQRVEGMELMKNLKITRGSTVLDLGCGTGGLTKELAELVGAEGKVVGIDPDEDRLKIAREKYSASNIEYLQADCETFPVGQYDIVYCNEVIHWIEDKSNLCRRVYDNLRPGGLFGFTTMDGRPPLPQIGWKVFSKVLGPDFMPRFLTKVMTFLTADEYHELARGIGFEPKYVTVRLDKDTKWSKLDHYIDTMHGWLSGGFDASKFDAETLQKLKKEFGDGPVEYDEPLRNLHIILSKPSF